MNLDTKLISCHMTKAPVGQDRNELVSCNYDRFEKTKSITPRHSIAEIKNQKLPISKKSPETAEHPGPPVSHSMRGSSAGFLSDSIK